MLSMSNYRFYDLDPDGRIGLADGIRASDDQDAIRQAQVLKHHARKCEVWKDKRLVAQMALNPWWPDPVSSLRAASALAWPACLPDLPAAGKRKPSHTGIAPVEPFLLDRWASAQVTPTN